MQTRRTHRRRWTTCAALLAAALSTVPGPSLAFELGGGETEFSQPVSPDFPEDWSDEWSDEWLLGGALGDSSGEVLVESSLRPKRAVVVRYWSTCPYSLSAHVYIIPNLRAGQWYGDTRDGGCAVYEWR